MNHPLIEKYVQHNQFGKLLGMEFHVLTEGVVEYRLFVKPEHLATPHAAHGGLIAALVDAALGVAALSAVCEQQKVVSTVEYKLNFLSPALKGDVLLAKAEVLQKGKRLIVVTCDVIAQNREFKLVSKAIGTFNAYEASKAGY